MAKGKIAINTEPHELEVGHLLLRFIPEAEGPEFMDLQNELTTWQAAVPENPTGDDLREGAQILREGLAGLMVDHENAKEFMNTPLPISVLQEILAWVSEAYARRPPTSSPDLQISSGETQK